MKLWSHGLGKRELKMDFRRCAIQRNEAGDIEVLGVITEPVTWEFRITLTAEDAAGLIRMALTPALIALILGHAPDYVRFLLHRKEFAPGDDLTARVQGAFDKMMNKGNRVEAWKQARAAKAADPAADAEPVEN
jgi:hypothetical protein